MKRIFVYIMVLAVSAALFAAVAGADVVSTFNLTASGGGDEANQVGQPTMPTPPPGGWQLPPRGEKTPPKYENMDYMLNQIADDYEQSERSFAAERNAAGKAPVSRQASVAVTFYTDAAQTQAIAQWLTDAGGDPRNIGEDYIEAYVPVSLLGEASEQPGVLSIRAVIPPQRSQITPPSEGAEAHGSLAWNAAGFSGQGIKVGIIDAGEGGFTSISSLVGTELPPIAGARCYSDLGSHSSNIASCEVGGYVHGTAVAEAVADIAPEVSLYIANPFSKGDLRATADWMVSQGVQVIAYSIGWTWDGPGDGTSPYNASPLNTVDRAVSAGTVWVNSAGNEALTTWFGEFRDSDGDGWHTFPSNPDTECNLVTLERGDPLIAQLRWDDVWIGSTKDIDLYLYRIAYDGSLILVDASLYPQIGRTFDEPWEIVFYFAESDGSYCLSVAQVNGTVPGWIQLNSFIGQELEFATLSSSIGNPAESANPGMLAVGAAPWIDTGVIEDFSSRGPSPDGRTKPDIVGANRAYSSAYGGGFWGTSQAAPHVAGMAALVRQRFPTYSPQQVADYLKANAEARGSVPNNTWGHGFAKLPQEQTEAVTPTPISAPTPAPVQSQVIAHVDSLSQAASTYDGMERYEKVNELCVSALPDALSARTLDVSDAERTAILTIQWVCYDAADKLGSSDTPPTPTPILASTQTPTPTPAPGEPPTSTPTPTPIATATIVPVSTPTNLCEYHPADAPSDTPIIKGRTLSNANYYYTPEHRLYGRRFIVDRWFCTVAEAEAAGYIPAP